MPTSSQQQQQQQVKRKGRVPAAAARHVGNGSIGSNASSRSSGGGFSGSIGMPGGFTAPRRYADRGFFDPFCMPAENGRCEPSCYFNPFVHAQCLGVDMNMEGFRKDILKCQEDYKKAVWAVLKKYAVGEGSNKSNSNSNVSNSLHNHFNNMMAGFDAINKNGNNFSGFDPVNKSGNNFSAFNPNPNNMSIMDMMDVLNPDIGGISSVNPVNPRRSKSSGFQFEDPRFTGHGGCGVYRNQLPM